MESLPDLDRTVNRSPHVVILGAGASVASFPNGEAGGLTLPLMNNIMELLDLNSLFAAKEVTPEGEDFEAIYDELVASGSNQELVRQIEYRVYDYFANMRLPDCLTIYDYLVLSLRDKDTIATFNWDPFLTQAFLRNKHIADMPRIIFLHGNVAIGACNEHKKKGYKNQQCPECNRVLDPVKLLYPVKHKDYTQDPFIRGEWEELRVELSRAYYLTIFGYSTPETDIEAKQLMLKTWKDNPTLNLAQVSIVDIKSAEELGQRWNDFFVREHYWLTKDIFGSYLFTHPRRSCDAFAAATLMNQPWKDNPFPRFSCLTDLHQWLLPLVIEERHYKKLGEPFSGKPCQLL